MTFSSSVSTATTRPATVAQSIPCCGDFRKCWFGSPRATLERWRWSGKGPAFVKLGGRVVYRLEVIETFEAEGNRTITGRFQ